MQKEVGLTQHQHAHDVRIPPMTIPDTWDTLLVGDARARLETLLPDYLKARRWFGGKARTIHAARISEVLRIPYAYALDTSAAQVPESDHNQHGSASASDHAYLTLIEVQYTSGAPQTYALSLGFAQGRRAAELLAEHPQAVVAHLTSEQSGETGIIYDAMWEQAVARVPLLAIAHSHEFAGEHGTLHASATRAFRQVAATAELATLPATLLRAEQSNTSVLYGRHFILKFFRKVEAGINPDLEIGCFLTEQTRFANTPPTAGTLEYRPVQGEPMPLAILQGFVANQGDAWEYTLRTLHDYFAALPGADATPPTQVPLPTHRHLLDIAQETPPEPVQALIGAYLGSARLLGQRTAEMHIALASAPDDAAFSPEPFDDAAQRSLYEAMRELCSSTLQTLRSRLETLAPAAQQDAHTLLHHEATLHGSFQSLLDSTCTSQRIRCHGDYHLGQVLYTGSDFMIIDFEGEPARPLSERRHKRSPLQDVAGMLRSFHYAAYAGLFQQVEAGHIPAGPVPHHDAWARCWYLWVAAAFLHTYLQVAGGQVFVPPQRTELQVLLDAYMLDKAIYELGYELNNRPDWVRIPLGGILQIVV